MKTCKKCCKEFPEDRMVKRKYFAKKSQKSQEWKDSWHECKKCKWRLEANRIKVAEQRHGLKC